MSEPKNSKEIAATQHKAAKRKNIPTAECEQLVHPSAKQPVRVAYQKRNPDLDPQLLWHGKYDKPEEQLEIQAPPLYIQEKIHPKAVLDELRRQIATQSGPDLFADFNGLPNEAAKTEFYQHEANWSNRMILGDSLKVMASLAEREGLRGKVQCIYLDPPYGIKFNSNFQWSTTSHDGRDDRRHITREPEQIKAFRDTWRYGIHSYLSYLRDRLIVARDLLTESGSIFVQIGDENVHRVRCLMDEVFGEENAFAIIAFRKKSFTNVGHSINDYVIHYARNKKLAKIRTLYGAKTKNVQTPNDNSFNQVLTIYGELVTPKDEDDKIRLIEEGGKWCRSADRLISQHYSETRSKNISLRNNIISPGSNAHWAFEPTISIPRLEKAGRLNLLKSGKLMAYTFWDDIPRKRINNFWEDIAAGADNKIYVVQTNTKVITRCILMASDPGDLVLDPTCGSGTTAHVAEKWGRRWITIDTSRVALALARGRLMGGCYPFYLLADSPEGQRQESKLAGQKDVAAAKPPVPPNIDNNIGQDIRNDIRNDIRLGFVYERVPHITLGSIANNAEIDVIYEKFQSQLEPCRQSLNAALGQTWEEWQIPRAAEASWPAAVRVLHAEWWQLRLARQREIDASIAAKANFEYLYDKPYENKKKVRVAGPFTVESLSPCRSLTLGPQDEFLDEFFAAGQSSPGSRGSHSSSGPGSQQDFVQMVLDNLRLAGVQQMEKDDKINFSTLEPWPGKYLSATGNYADDSGERCAAIFIGPQFGTVARADLVAAAKEAAESDFDILVACAFNYDGQSTELANLGRLPILRARINADLHMAENLKNTGKGNLFVIFGEPDLEIKELDDGRLCVEIKGIDVFDPKRDEVRSAGTEGIACWFVDTDYNEESFFVRQAYFLGADDPYKSLKKTLKAEIDPAAWGTLNSNISRPFAKPPSGRIAVKVLNYFGDEVMKIYQV